MSFDVRQRAKDWVDAWMRAPYKGTQWGGLPESSHLEEEDLERLLTRARQDAIETAEEEILYDVSRLGSSQPSWDFQSGFNAARLKVTTLIHERRRRREEEQADE